MPKPIIKFKCDHCSKSFSGQSYAEKHETRCIHNPEQLACPTCLYDDESSCFKGYRDPAVHMIRDCSHWVDQETEWPDTEVP